MNSVAATYNTVLTAKDKTSAAFKSLGNSAAASAMKVAKIGAAFATVGIAAGIALTKMSMQNVDALAKVSDRLGIATQSLAGLQHAASIAGVETATLEKSLVKLAIGVSDAADGTGEAKDAFIELGLSAAQLEKLPVDQQLLRVADAMQGVELQADKVRIAADLFGARGVAVLNMLGDGSENLVKMAKEADHLGIAINRVDAAKIELANDAVTRAKGVFTGLGNQLATAFSPIIGGVATEFYQAALDAEGFGNIGQDVADALVTGFGYVLDTVQMVQHGMLALELVALKSKKALQDVFEPDAAYKEQKRQADEMEIAVSKGHKTRMEFDAWQIKSQKQVRDGTFMVNAAIKTGSDATQVAIDAVISKMAEFTSTTLPSDKISLLYKRIVAESEAAGKAIADNAPGKVLLQDADSDGAKIQEKMTFFQEQEIAGKKKLEAFNLQSSTAQTAHVLGELGNQFAGIASSNKRLFALNKAFQIAQAIMQTYQGATLAMSSYPPPLNFVMAAATVASGLGQVAQIKAQSFDGGGFTGSGSRSGGIDGKGGFPAVLHPNETVVDHTKGQGGMGGITIINNIDAKGADASVDMKIRAAMQQTSQQTVMTIQDLIRRRRFA
jgi:hypothetical protein